MKTLCIKWLLHDMELMAIKIVHVCLLLELKLFMFMEVGTTDSKTFKLTSVWWMCERNLVIVVYQKQLFSVQNVKFGCVVVFYRLNWKVKPVVVWVYNVYVAKVIAIDISHIYSRCADMIDMQTWNFKTFTKTKAFY